MTKRTFILVHDTARTMAQRCVAQAPDGFMVVVSEPTKKRVQEEKYHAMIGDIARQQTFMDRKFDADDWKRLLVDAFATVMREQGTPLHNDGRVVPSLDFGRTVQLGVQTRDFYVAEAAQFIEFLMAWGIDKGVRWSAPRHMEEVR